MSKKNSTPTAVPADVSNSELNKLTRQLEKAPTAKVKAELTARIAELTASARFVLKFENRTFIFNSDKVLRRFNRQNGYPNVLLVKATENEQNVWSFPSLEYSGNHDPITNKSDLTARPYLAKALKAYEARQAAAAKAAEAEAAAKAKAAKAAPAVEPAAEAAPSK